jgi:hypothetical protein
MVTVVVETPVLDAAPELLPILERLEELSGREGVLPQRAEQRRALGKD